MLQAPHDRRRHLPRIEAAAALAGSEPVQGALADMLSACAPDPDGDGPLLQRLAQSGRIPAHAADALLEHVRQGRRLPRVTVLATRYSVLATPSLDVPVRALLCGSDDSRRIAAEAVSRLPRGDAEFEEAFLSHCEETHDTVALLLAWSRLRRSGFHFSERWQSVIDGLT